MAKTEFPRLRGMPDWLPPEAYSLRQTMSKLANVCQHYGYQEIITPALESVQLFERSVGAATDIMEKELYRVPLPGGEIAALRPEGTASVARAVVEHQLARGQSAKLYYQGLMWRHDRPQKGRYRQFHQLGVEQFGDLFAEVELIALSWRWWNMLGLQQQLSLQIHSLGDLACRHQYLAALVHYLKQNFDDLDEDCRRRLDSNPMRILDSKNPKVQTILRQAPQMLDYLNQDAAQHWQQVCQALQQLGIPYQINPTLVRGLDYYNRTVFEWVTTTSDSTTTVLAGGRFDGLSTIIADQPLLACGMALGVERLLSLLAAPSMLQPHCLCLAIDDNSWQTMVLWELIRDAVPNLHGWLIASTSLKKGLSQANRYQPKYVLISGVSERQNGSYILKNMADGQQQLLHQSQLISFLQGCVSCSI